MLLLAIWLFGLDRPLNSLSAAVAYLEPDGSTEAVLGAVVRPPAPVAPDGRALLAAPVATPVPRLLRFERVPRHDPFQLEQGADRGDRAGAGVGPGWRHLRRSNLVAGSGLGWRHLRRVRRLLVLLRRRLDRFCRERQRLRRKRRGLRCHLGSMLEPWSRPGMPVERDER